MINATSQMATTKYHTGQRGNSGGFSSCLCMSIAFREHRSAQEAERQPYQQADLHAFDREAQYEAEHDAHRGR